MYVKGKVSINDSSAQNSTVLSPLKLNCSSVAPISVPARPTTTKKNGLLKFPLGFVVVIGGVELVCITLGWWYLFRKYSVPVHDLQGYSVIPSGFKRFSFAKLKKATNNFTERVRKGGFGTVYRGVLGDSKVVAVKRLEGVCHSEEQFWAEVSIIGRVHHMHLVRMFGFCAEGDHRLLVYEYVANGSLEKYLFSEGRVLDWNQRFKIAVGTAKGFGIVLLENIVSGPSSSGSFSDQPNQLAEWIWEGMKEERWIEIVVDSKLNGKVAVEEVERGLRTGLRCVEQDRNARPSMSETVEMLSPISDDMNVFTSTESSSFNVEATAAFPFHDRLPGHDGWVLKLLEAPKENVMKYVPLYEMQVIDEDEVRNNVLCSSPCDPYSMRKTKLLGQMDTRRKKIRSWMLEVDCDIRPSGNYAAESAAHVVRVALFPPGGPSGNFFNMHKMASF
eukprot:Gb_37916 [translate_table: standard]